jgi:hypothetical protein
MSVPSVHITSNGELIQTNLLVLVEPCTQPLQHTCSAHHQWEGGVALAQPSLENETSLEKYLGVDGW